MQTKQWMVSRCSEILSLAAQHGASNVRVFGSVARGDDDTESDIDIMVDLEPGRSLFERDVDVVTEKGLRPALRERVPTEAVVL